MKAGGSVYEIVIRGEIGDRFALLFEGMRLERAAGRTVITGPVLDQAHLLGLIERVQELGLELISVNPRPGDREERADAIRDGA
jgi:hypothetical protein